MSEELEIFNDYIRNPFLSYKDKEKYLDIIEKALKEYEIAKNIIKEFAPLITINIKGKEYDIKANNTSDIALFAEVYINDRLIYATMSRDKIEKLGLLKEILK